MGRKFKRAIISRLRQEIINKIRLQYRNQIMLVSIKSRSRQMHETTAQTIIASIIKLDQEKREKRKDGKLTNVFFYTFRIGDKRSNEIKKKR